MSKRERQMQKFLGNSSSKKEVEVTGKIFDYFKPLKLSWYFEKPYEKIILVILCFLGLLKIKDVVRGWLF